ncbi:MAG: threonine synthase [Enterobacterales bacterium]|nr:threonine synthase [Enterobacterales bacterium]
MSFVKHQQCSFCGKIYATQQLMNLCPADQKPIEMQFDLEAIKQQKPNLTWYQPQIKSMWRFGSLLPLDISDTNDQKHIISLSEGYTPEIPLHKNTHAKKHGFQLFLKDEGQPHTGYGANPTGSFKDRGMSMAISMAHQFALNKLVVPTQGNAGDSLAEYAIKAGMQAVIIMPDDTPMPILGRVSALAKMRNDIEIELVKGTIKEAGALMKQKYLPQGYFNMATFQEPGWRIDGKKTLGLELAEPKPDQGQTKWQLPDVVLYPTGGGTGILGMWKAWDELETLGVIGSKRPKVISVQSENTAPVVQAFKQGESDPKPVVPGHTLSVGLNVPGGVGHFKVLQIIHQSGGSAIAVNEQQIAQNLKDTYQTYGIWICPEGAATLAAIEPAIEQGLIKSGDKVVAFNTGSFEKYLPNVRHLIFD